MITMNHRHQVFITQMLLHGDKEEAYSAAYPLAKGRSISVGANKLLADPEVKKALDKAHANVHKKLEAEIAEQKKAEMLTTERMKELLTKIAEGELETTRQLRTKDGYEPVQEKPAHWHILRAIYTYCRITGQFKQAEKEAMQEIPPGPVTIMLGNMEISEYFDKQRSIKLEYCDEEDEEYNTGLVPDNSDTKDKFFAYQQKRTAKRDAARTSMTPEELKAEQEALTEFAKRGADDAYLPATHVADMLWEIYLLDKTEEKLANYRALIKMVGLQYLPHRHRWQAENEAGWEFHPADIQLIRKRGKQFSTINSKKKQDFENGKAA
jgi:hypothetical protein